MEEYQGVSTDSGAGFVQLLNAIRQGRHSTEHAEETDIERVMDKVADKASVLHRTPRKYLRAFIALLDFRLLELGTYMSESRDGVSMAHNQGRLKEAGELQEILRFFLDQQLEEAE